MNPPRRESRRHSNPTTIDGVAKAELNAELGDVLADQEKIASPSFGEYQQPNEIEYLYLTFETPLPHPVGIASPQPGQAAPPPCPDLTKYASPFLWSESRKTVVTMISCGVTAMSAYAAGEYTPPSDELTRKWGISKVVYNLGITLFTLGFGIAPMVLAPFSEINGRRSIFILSGLVFTGMP
jgi:hypothetical protein